MGRVAGQGAAQVGLGPFQVEARHTLKGLAVGVLRAPLPAAHVRAVEHAQELIGGGHGAAARSTLDQHHPTHTPVAVDGRPARIAPLHLVADEGHDAQRVVLELACSLHHPQAHGGHQRAALGLGEGVVVSEAQGGDGCTAVDAPVQPQRGRVHQVRNLEHRDVAHLVGFDHGRCHAAVRLRGLTGSGGAHDALDRLQAHRHGLVVLHPLSGEGGGVRLAGERQVLEVRGLRQLIRRRLHHVGGGNQVAVGRHAEGGALPAHRPSSRRQVYDRAVLGAQPREPGGHLHPPHRGHGKQRGAIERLRRQRVGHPGGDVGTCVPRNPGDSYPQCHGDGQRKRENVVAKPHPGGG